MTEYALLLLAIPVIGTAVVVLALEVSSRLHPVPRVTNKRK
jgi:hypothetical protein